MPDQSDPVSPDEYVLRRIPNQRGYYEPAREMPVVRGAFVPGKNDIDGLSVFRGMFTTAEEVATIGGTRDEGYVAQLLASEIIILGLSVVPDPQDDQLPGHALIPEINYREYLESKAMLREIQLKLVRIAGRNIIFRPADA